MDIQTLRLLVTEDELNSLLAGQLPENTSVKELHIGLLPEGVQVTGRYTGMLLPINFEMLWELAVVAGLLEAKLANIKVAGLPATKMRGILLGVLFDQIGEQPGIKREGEVIRLNLTEILKARNIPVRMNAVAVHCARGSLLFEGGL